MPILAEPLPVPEPEDAAAPTDDYAHVILDEAQDLSPMECRMIARRAEYASMTIVGDLGQATHPLAAGSWPELLARLGRRDARTLELRTGYRVPQVIADYATRFLAPGDRGDPLVPDRRHAVGPAGRRPRRPRSARPSGTRPATARPRSSRPTAPSTTSRRSSTGPDVTLLPASLVKGLEYDHVIVVEPADIVAAEPRGYSRLYVVLTRAVSSLVVLHRDPLPDPVRTADELLSEVDIG